METTMHFIKEIQLITIFEILHYLVPVGIAYWFFYSFKKDDWLKNKIQKRFPNNEHIWFEIKYSILNMFIFILMAFGVYLLKINGYTQMYDNVSDYGLPYLIFSVIAMIIIHDTYFYWTHRFMHLKSVYPHVHQVHHHSTNPTPWASYSFHPIEGVLDNAIIPIVVILLPVHIYALIAFMTFTIILNVGGHLGFEIFKEGFTRNKITGLSNTSTHHNMHHSHFNYNYGIYFNVWDQLMGTNHPEYHNVFDKVARERDESKEGKIEGNMIKGNNH